MRKLIAGVVLALGLLPVPPTAVAASPSVTHADPAVGPNALDEARHAHDPLQLQPATTAIQPLHARRMPMQPYQLQGPTTNPAGGVDREVLGFAPYWSIADSGRWNYSLITTVAYFGLDINADGR